MASGELENKNNSNYEKGIIFEKYVVNLFDPSCFIFNDCSRDNSKHYDRKVESDQNPDITMRCISTNILFSVECKFMSALCYDKVKWAKYYQIINYMSYAIKTGRPTFVVIGLGGSPDDPDRMFCLPIAEAKYPELFISMLKNYERIPSKMFFWKNGNLE